MTTRRSFLAGITGTIIAAPAIVRVSSLMAMPRAPLAKPTAWLLYDFDKGTLQPLTELQYARYQPIVVPPGLYARITELGMPEVHHCKPSRLLRP